ncbi:MAG: phosphatase PAP2 family protein [Proteobacteria bacterium]|nr:phosphatase PAP2 family protein [Pseudomonadota bacterium]
MTRREWIKKSAWFASMIAYFALGYALLTKISQGSERFFDVSMGFESQIPFVPAFIFGYLLVFLSVSLAYIVIDDMDEWMKSARAYFISTTIAYILFFLFPVRMDLRPVIETATGLTEWGAQLYFSIDAPYNCFPSLHVTYPVLAVIAVWGRYRRLRWLFAAMALAVSISVVMVKQHYIADVIAGMANAGLSYWLAVAYERYTVLRRDAEVPLTG